VSKKYFSATDERINLKKVEKGCTVECLTRVNSKKVDDIISTRESADIERSTVQAFPALTLSVVARPFREDQSTTRSFVNPNFTAEQVRQTFRKSRDKIDPNNVYYDSNEFSDIHGYDRVNAKRALEIVKKRA
jgi:hypothetical protein